jgi:HD-like signal output (HDOD) protein
LAPQPTVSDHAAFMFRSLLDRLRGRRAASTPPRSASVAPAPPPSAPAGRASRQPPEPPPVDQHDDAGIRWRGALIAAHEELWTGFTARRDYPDVEQLLTAVVRDPATAIRQLPTAARDALALCDAADVSRTRLAAALGKDPALVQALLRQANSAMLGGGRAPVLGVDAAIGRIGLAGTRAVVLANCVTGLLSNPGGAFAPMVAAIWDHMVRTGPLAHALAPAMGADPDEAFAVALLHDVGKLVIFDRLSALRTASRRDLMLPPGWISQALGMLHEPLGALAALRWGLGPAAADAIGRHHRAAETLPQDPLAETLFLAERVDHCARRGQVPDLLVLWDVGQLSGDLDAAAAILGEDPTVEVLEGDATRAA